MTEQHEPKRNQTWRRIKGVQRGKLVVIEYTSPIFGIVWRGNEGGRGCLLRNEWHNRYEFVEEAPL